MWHIAMPGAGAIHSINGGRCLIVHEQVQRAVGAPIRDLDGQDLLPGAQRRVVRYRPVQSRHPQQADHHSRRLPQRQLEQDLERETELDGAFGENRGTPRPSFVWREPRHLPVQPDQQGATLAQRGAIGGPVRRAVAGRHRLRHVAHLSS